MKKKTIIISGMAAVLVIGSVVFCFAVKGDSTQSAEVAQTVEEAVATPTIEIPEEVVEEPEVAEVPEEPVETPEVVEETTEVEETSSEGSIVDVAETTEEDSEDAGVPTQTEEVKPVETQPEEVKPAETKPVETQPQQTTVDAQRDAILAQAYALGATDGIPDSTSVLGNYTGNAGAGLQWE